MNRWSLLTACYYYMSCAYAWLRISPRWKTLGQFYDICHIFNCIRRTVYMVACTESWLILKWEYKHFDLFSLRTSNETSRKGKEFKRITSQVRGRAYESPGQTGIPKLVHCFSLSCIVSESEFIVSTFYSWAKGLYHDRFISQECWQVGHSRKWFITWYQSNKLT